MNKIVTAPLLTVVLADLGGRWWPAVAELFTGYEITDRGTLGFGVPVVRSGASYGSDKPTALDILPRGTPVDTSWGRAWFHICDADVLASPDSAFNCGYMGAFNDHVEIGTKSFNGEPARPLKLRVGDAIVGELNAVGLIIYGTVTANAFAGGAPPIRAILPPSTTMIVLCRTLPRPSSTVAALRTMGRFCAAAMAANNTAPLRNRNHFSIVSFLREN